VERGSRGRWGCAPRRPCRAVAHRFALPPIKPWPGQAPSLADSVTEETLPLPVDQSTRPMAPIPGQWLQLGESVSSVPSFRSLAACVWHNGIASQCCECHAGGGPPNPRIFEVSLGSSCQGVALGQAVPRCVSQLEECGWGFRLPSSCLRGAVSCHAPRRRPPLDTLRGTSLPGGQREGRDRIADVWHVSSARIQQLTKTRFSLQGYLT